jgi:hypothetical protein
MNRLRTALALLALAAALAAAPRAGADVRICRTLEEAVPAGTSVVLLVFFATDCPVCYDGLFESRYTVDKGGWPVAVVGVYTGPAEDLRSFLEKYDWSLPVVLDRRRLLARKFHVDMAPDRVLVVGGELFFRDAQHADPGRRREALERCLNKIFSR